MNSVCFSNLKGFTWFTLVAITFCSGCILRFAPAALIIIKRNVGTLYHKHCSINNFPKLQNEFNILIFFIDFTSSDVQGAIFQ